METADAVSIEYQIDEPQWFAICTNPMQEERAYQNLLAANVECFNPKIQESRRNQFTGVVTHGRYSLDIFLLALVSSVHFAQSGSREAY